MFYAGLRAAESGRNDLFRFYATQRELLKDEQIAEILTYVRSSWGNQAAAVTPGQVALVRKRYGPEEPGVRTSW